MIRRFVKDAVIYALPMFLARAIGLILLPIYTRQLGPTDFGFVEFVAAISVILLIVLPLELNQAVARLLPESDDQNRQKKILSSALWFTTIGFAGFGAVVYLLRFQLLEIVNLPGEYAQYAALVCIHFLILAIVNLLQVQFRFTSQAKSSVAINMAVVLTNLGMVLYFAAFDNLGIEQYYWSQIVSGLVGISIGLILLVIKHGHLFGQIDVPILRELFKYSLPIVLSSIGVVLSGSVDKLMVGGYVGLSELGYYGVAARLAAIVGLGFYVISTAMTPIVYRDHERGETRKLITKLFHVSVAGSIGLLLLVVFYSKSIIMLLAGDGFEKGAEYMFYLMASAVIANLYIFFLGMDIAKETGLLSKINLSTGLLGAIACAVLIPLTGIWGAIVAALGANTARLAGYIYFSQRRYQIPIALHWPFISIAALMAFNFYWANRL